MVRRRDSARSAAKIAASVVGVDGGGRVVEDQDPRVGEQRAGQRDPLPLPAGQREPAFADHGVVPVRQRVDELVGRRPVGGGADLLGGGVGPAEGDVGRDGVGEQERLVEDEADGVAQLLGAQLRRRRTTRPPT